MLLIEEGIRDYRVTGSIVWAPLFLALKAEALQLRVVPLTFSRR